MNKFLETNDHSYCSLQTDVDIIFCMILAVIQCCAFLIVKFSEKNNACVILDEL